MLGKRRRDLGGCLVAFAALLSCLPVAHAANEDDDEGEPRPRVIDPGVSVGPALEGAVRPKFSHDARACSTRVPVCVHAPDARDGQAVLATLDAFERAWQTLTGAIAVPAPEVDPFTLAYDVFLTEPSPPDLATTTLETRDVRSNLDRARGFTLVDNRVRPSCMLDALAARELAHASLLRVAPATELGTVRAQTTYLAELVAPCAVGLGIDSAAAFQSRPDRALADAHAGSSHAVAGEASRDERSVVDGLFSAGASMFWARLDWALGRRPGGIVTAAWALHPTITALGASRWTNEPDTFDVLRSTFTGVLSKRGKVDDVYVDFAIARAFVGSADDGLHLPELKTLGDAARIATDWDIAWPASPRRLTPRAPVYPTGASYVVVRHAGAPKNARLRVEIDWEEHALFRWVFVKLDAQGRELGRVVIPTTERATEARLTLVELDQVDRLMLVGVNLGDPSYAFDPDDEVWEPHAWNMIISEERPTD